MTNYKFTKAFLPLHLVGKTSSGSPAPDPTLPSTTPIEISRIMLPDDTNTSGNVHGGTILKMIEQAGHIVANRHCNLHRKEEEPPITTALVRLEKMDFHQPMLVGEVAQLQAAVTYTSPHSLEVMVDVWAENVITGERRHANTASLWYVGLKSDVKISDGMPLKVCVISVPRLTGLSKDEDEAGRRRYDAQKNSRRQAGGPSGSDHTSNPPVHIYCPPEEVEKHTVLASQTTLANIVLPSDCTVTGHMLGGALMKMMDNAAGICAARHCRGRTVTAGIGVINFHETIRNGEIVFVTARIVFTSAKSMEIEVSRYWMFEAGYSILYTSVSRNSNWWLCAFLCHPLPDTLLIIIINPCFVNRFKPEVKRKGVW